MHEVHILHRLSSPHVMRFIDWYETRNNLWLILVSACYAANHAATMQALAHCRSSTQEYCTGGDLRTLLKQEGSLPETSIQMFGADVLAAMQVNSCCQFRTFDGELLTRWGRVHGTWICSTYIRTGSCCATFGRRTS